MFAGSLVFETPVDTKGVETGFKEIKGELGGLKNVATDTGRAINAAFSGDFSKPIASAQARINDLLRQFETVSTSLKDAIAADDDSAAAKYGKQQIRIYDQLEAAREKLAIAIQEATQKQAEAEEKAAERTQRAAEKTQKALSDTSSSAKAVEGGSGGISKGMNIAGKSIKRFGTRLVGIISSALVFNIIGAGLREMTSYMSATLKTSKSFTAELAKLKGALLTAFQPIYTYILPVIVKLIKYLTAAANAVAYFFSMFTGASIQSSAKAAENLYNEANAIGAVGGAAKKAKKALAGFDEINTLPSSDDGSGGGGGAAAPDFSAINSFSLPAEIESAITSLKERILAGDWYGVGKELATTITDGIANFDWTHAGEIIGEGLGGAFSFVLGLALNLDPIIITEAAWEIATGLFTGLKEAIAEMNWQEIGGDMAAFLVKALIAGIFYLDPRYMILSLIFNPKGKKLTSSVAGFVGAILGALFKAFLGTAAKLGEIGKWLWETLKKHVDEYVNWEGTPDEIISGLFNGIIAAFSEVKTWVKENIWEPLVDGFCEAAGIDGETCQGMKAIGNMIIDGGLCSGMLEKIKNVKQACGEIWSAIKEKFAPVKTWFKETFSDAWKAVKDVFSPGEGTIFDGIKEGIAETFRTIVNKLISGINRVIATPFNRINGLLNTIRSISVMGTKPFIGMWSYNPLAVPQIPYLAQGAVLPANKPFMAVVGDQKHGTNIEAPLATIQEAVAVVMENYSAANMAGHEATVAVLRELLEAVLGISIGDDVIANAVTRYNQKMAVVRGG